MGICKEAHRELGMGLKEILYKDAIEMEKASPKSPPIEGTYHLTIPSQLLWSTSFNRKVTEKIPFHFFNLEGAWFKCILQRHGSIKYQPLLCRIFI